MLTQAEIDMAINDEDVNKLAAEIERLQAEVAEAKTLMRDLLDAMAWDWPECDSMDAWLKKLETSK